MNITIILTIAAVCVINTFFFNTLNSSSNKNDELLTRVRNAKLIRKRIDYFGNYKKELQKYKRTESNKSVKMLIDVEVCMGNSIEYDSISTLSIYGSFEKNYVIFLKLYSKSDVQGYLLTSKSPFESSGNECEEIIEISNLKLQKYEEIFTRIEKYSEIEKRPPHMILDGFIVQMTKFYNAKNYYYSYSKNNPTIDYLPNLYNILIDLKKWSYENYPNGYHDLILKKYIQEQPNRR